MVYSELSNELKNIFGVDEVINLSKVGSSPDRQIRVTIEWIAQNGNPDMVILPVSHFNRFDLPVAKNCDHMDNMNLRMAWTMDLKDIKKENIIDLVDLDTLKTYMKTGALVHQIGHPAHDYLFVKLLTFQSYLEMNNIRHLIFDTGNCYEKIWMTHLTMGAKSNPGYQPGMKKIDLVKKCQGIYKFFSFCSNLWMYENCVSDKENYVPYGEKKALPYPLDLHQMATIHHQKDQTLQLIKHLAKEGAVYG